MQADGIGGKPRVASWRRGANADLPLGPGLGKSLGFTLAADGQEGSSSARLTTIQSLLVLPTSDRIGRPQAGAPLLELGSVTQESIALSFWVPIYRSLSCCRLLLDCSKSLFYRQAPVSAVTP